MCIAHQTLEVGNTVALVSPSKGWVDKRAFIFSLSFSQMSVHWEDLISHNWMKDGKGNSLIITGETDPYAPWSGLAGVGGWTPCFLDPGLGSMRHVPTLTLDWGPWDTCPHWRWTGVHETCAHTVSQRPFNMVIPDACGGNHSREYPKSASLSSLSSPVSLSSTPTHAPRTPSTT